MNPIDLQKYRLLIDDAITFDDLDQAREYVQQALAEAVRREDVGEQMYFRAQWEIIHEHYHAAICYLDQAIRFNPNDGAAYNDRATSMVELGQISGVLEYFDRGIEVEPDFATIHHNKGWFLNQLGEHQKALVSLNAALELDSSRAVTYENRADCLYKMGLVVEAIESYEQALSCLGSDRDSIRNQIQKLITLLKSLKPRRSDLP